MQKNSINTPMSSYLLGGFMFLVSILSANILASSFVAADNSVIDEVSIAVPVSCTLSGTGMNSHTAEVDNGAYRTEIGSTTLHAICNDSEGFAIFASGFTGDEIGGENSNKLVGDSVSIGNIVTGINETGNISNWAMKLTKLSDTNDTTNNPLTIDSDTEGPFSTYHTVPNSYVKVAHKNAATDMDTSTGGAKLTTTYAVYISSTQSTGTYTGKVKYTLVHPASEIPAQPQTTASGQICYYANTTTALGTMGCQSIASSVTLLASNFSRDGYGFAGWSDAYDYGTNQNAHFYGPQETITLNTADYTGNNPGLSLYAVWVKSEGSLQDQSKVTALCGTSPTTGSLTIAPTNGTANLSSVSALTDQRDNQTYAIARLADGKCWMIENLRLESTNSDNSTGALAQGYHSSFIGLSSSESANFSNSTTANDLYTTENNIQGKITISGDYQGYRFPRYNNTNTSARASNPAPSSNSSAMYSYGNYYTWHAAIADLTYNGTNDQSTTGTSLCPTGWHLPTGGHVSADSGVNITGDTSTFREFYNLGYKTIDEVKTAYEDTPYDGYAYYSSNTTNVAGKTATNAFRSFPNNFLYSGFFDSSSAYVRGSYGRYWSSVAGGSISAYDLYINSSNVYPGTNASHKSHGQSIRCIAGS